MMCEGKVAVVTGAAGKGIGRSIALTLAREGAKVVVNYRTSEESAKAVVEHIASRGASAVAVQADVSDEDGCKKLVEAACEKFGQVDILVNNAGGGWEIRDYTDIPLDDWKAVLAGEIGSTFLLMKHVAPGMRQRRWGRIIHLGMGGVLGYRSVKGLAPDYCLGKAARAWMTRAFGLDEFASGITVNCIEPSIVGPFQALEEAVEQCDHGPAWAKRITSSPQDIAEGVAFLCSEAGEFISGTILPYMFREPREVDKGAKPPPGWCVAEGRWSVDAGGRITGESGESAYLYRTEEHPDDVRITATMRAVHGYEITVWICGSPEKTEMDGYTLAVSTEKAKLQRRGEDVAADEKVTIEPDRDHVLAFERRGSRLRGFLDGSAEPFIEWPVPNPLRGEGHRTLGFYVWEGTVAVSQIEVEELNA